MVLQRRLGFFSICILGTMLIACSAVLADLTAIPLGGDVFIGEQGLTIPVGSGTVLSWYSGHQTPGVSSPGATVTVGDPNNFYVAPSPFAGHTGYWYLGNTTTIVFNVNDPSLDIKIWDQQLQRDVTGNECPIRRLP